MTSRMAIPTSVAYKHVNVARASRDGIQEDLAAQVYSGSAFSGRARVDVVEIADVVCTGDDRE